MTLPGITAGAGVGGAAGERLAAPRSRDGCRLLEFLRQLVDAQAA
jgi:hypothetical protein